MSSHILVINDDPSILELFRLILEPEGYKVTTSEFAFENLRGVEHLHPDLIILDLKIGASNQGWKMLQQLKMYPPTRDIALILCTAALLEAQEQEETLREKGIPIIYKPFDMDELLHVVHQFFPLLSRDGVEASLD